VDNLVSNAVKFTPPGGRLEVRALVQDDKAILADTGIGISPSDREQILTPSSARRSRPSARSRAPASAWRL
jgi:signal transduction histidine kinase